MEGLVLDYLVSHWQQLTSIKPTFLLTQPTWNEKNLYMCSEGLRI